LRERAFNLRVAAYFGSKLLVLMLIAVLQASLLFAIVRPWCNPPGPAAEQWATLAALATAGTAVGLLISALARTEEVATALVPIVVIPQIILAGIVAPLAGLARGLARGAVSVYWGQQALERLLPSDDLRMMAIDEGNWLNPLAVVVLHALAASIAAVVARRMTGEKTSR
jgi:hypothetical protein